MKAFKIIMLSLFGMGIISINNEGYCSTNTSDGIQTSNRLQLENPQPKNNHQRLEMLDIDQPRNPITMNLPEIKNPSINELREIVKINKEGAGAGEIEDDFLKGKISFPGGFPQKVIDTVQNAGLELQKMGKIDNKSNEYKSASNIVKRLVDTFEKINTISIHPDKEIIVKELLCLSVYKIAKKIVEANKTEKLNNQTDNIENSLQSNLDRGNKNEIVFVDNIDNEE